MKIIHENVLNHLLKSKQTCFALRKKSKKNEKQWSQGFWFLGDETHLRTSFWDSKDWRNKTHNISFCINALGHAWLECVDKDGTEKAHFFEEIAEILDLSRLKTKKFELPIVTIDHFIWKKFYEPTSYIAALDAFLKKDKPIIDAFIQLKKKSNLFKPIDKNIFDQDLAYVYSWRAEPPQHTPIKEIPIRLQKVSLQNIGHFNSIEINLNQQVTCLIGENGSGKTSILRAIALGLAGINDNTVIDPNNLAIQKMLRIQKIEGSQEAYSSNGQIKIVYNEKQETNIIHFEFQKGESVDNEGKITQNSIKTDDLGSDLTATEGNFFKNLIIAFSQVKTNEKHRTENLELKPRISDVTALIYNRPDESFEYFRTWILRIWRTETSEKERSIQLEVIKSIFAVLQKIVGGIFELMPMQMEPSEVFIKTTDAPFGVPLRLISQGYNNVIGWVGHFMQRLWEVTPEPDKTHFKNTSAICLIDEIDTYLHPKWEKTILSVLLASFPHTQFVVTTHSPLIITHLNSSKYHVAIYRVAHEGVEKIQAAGQDISTAMRMHFGIERRPDFYQHQIDQLFSDFEKFEAGASDITIQNLEQQFKELESLLGKTDPDIETAARILEVINLPLD